MLREPKTKKLTFRLTEQEYEYLTTSAYVMGATPSQFARMLIQMAINAAKMGESVAKGVEVEPIKVNADN